jgi:osmotically inducible protein OsmC
MTKLDKILYTAKAKSTGGREGTSSSDDGRLTLTLSTPKALGGNDGHGTNPEQLFAAGYSACFIGAMKFVAGTEKIKLPDGFNVEAKVGIGPIPAGFGIKVDMQVNLPGMAADQASKVVEKAHQVCPYSNATRGNIEVNFKIQNEII